MKTACRKIHGGCDYICTSDWTCTKIWRACKYRGRKMPARGGFEILADLIIDLDPIERQALIRYLEDDHDKG